MGSSDVQSASVGLGSHPLRPHESTRAWKVTAPTRHFVVLSKVWFFIVKFLVKFSVKYIVFETYPLLAPKCRVGAGNWYVLYIKGIYVIGHGHGHAPKK
jgi:hypothetical protein